MSVIFISKVAGKIPTVSQLMLADSRMGYNQADGILYVLRVVGNFKTVVAVNGTNAPVTIPDGNFKGTATLTTNPGTPTADEWWTATQVGVYTNFGGVSVTTITDVLNYLKWDQGTTAWSLETVDIPSGNLHNRLHSITSAVDHAAADTADFDKLIATNPSTGAIEFVAKPAVASAYDYWAIKNNCIRTIEYGALYNWYAASYNEGGASIAPAGYHVPSKAEFETLVAELTAVYISDIANKVKTTGILKWIADTGADNLTGFSAVGNGRREPYDGSFSEFKEEGSLWCSDSHDANNGRIFLAQAIQTYLYIHYPISKIYGFGIRAIKDNSINDGTVTDYDGNIYPTVKIGDQVWMAANLAVTHYNDGTPIPNVTSNSEWTTLTTGAYCWHQNDISYGYTETADYINMDNLAVLEIASAGVLTNEITETPTGAKIKLTVLPSTSQIQSDWNQSVNTELDFIKNKPLIPSAQIQSNWNQTNNTALDFIKNKPFFLQYQMQSDWAQEDFEADDYIKNKPTIPSAVTKEQVEAVLTGEISSHSHAGAGLTQQQIEGLL